VRLLYVIIDVVTWLALGRGSIEGLVERLEYDPNRSSYIALVRYPAGKMVTLL
jgi:ribosomal protein L2